jgi:hypothetical protein
MAKRQADAEGDYDMCMSASFPGRTHCFTY